MHFMHLYFLPGHFTQRAVQELDREPREVTLADRTYFEDARIASLCQTLVNEAWLTPDSLLRTNETAHEVLSLLLRAQGVRRTGGPLKGGLSVATRRRLRDYIESHLAQPLTLGELAGVAALSELLEAPPLPQEEETRAEPPQEPESPLGTPAGPRGDDQLDIFTP